MRVKRKAKRDPVPAEFPSLEAAGEFWDTHDATDYWDLTSPVEDYRCRIEREQHLIVLKPSIARRLRKAAKRQGVSSEALANRWLRDKLKTAKS